MTHFLYFVVVYFGVCALVAAGIIASTDGVPWVWQRLSKSARLLVELAIIVTIAVLGFQDISPDSTITWAMLHSGWVETGELIRMLALMALATCAGMWAFSDWLESQRQKDPTRCFHCGKLYDVEDHAVKEPALAVKDPTICDACRRLAIPAPLRVAGSTARFASSHAPAYACPRCRVFWLA